MSRENLEILKLGLWLMRLLGENSVLSRAKDDPMLFASWYILGGKLLDLPAQAKALQEEHRSTTISMERALRLLEQLGKGKAFQDISLDEARLMLEGYAIHECLSRDWDAFERTVQAQAKTLDSHIEARVSNLPNTVSKRVREFSQIVKLQPVEEKVLTLAFTCAVVGHFRDLLHQLIKGRRGNVAQLWCAILDCTEDELRQALSQSGVLRKSRILRSKGKDTPLPSISEFWVDVLTDPLESVFDSLLKPLVIVPGAGIPAHMNDDDFGLAVEILRNGASSAEAGVNLLLYGADSFENRSLLGDLLSQSQKSGYVLKDFENAYGELPCICYVAQRVLFDTHGDDAVLIVERPGDVLERKPPEFLRTMFGIELNSAHIAPIDQLLLDSNPAPTIWAGPGSNNLLEECIARFVFHAPLKKARREDRRAQLERLVVDLKLYKSTKTEILSLEDVSAKQIEAGLRASRLSGAVSKREREDALVRAVRRSLAALKRDTTARVKECVTEYSLEYINHAGKFGPDQILRALRLRPMGSMCLYGPPGTGKTQFVEHLAQQLGRRLIVKRASDLLSKWLGDNEKNLAAMFQEAEAEEAILFLDEGDSFLRDRSLATQSWEVTKVNELLQGMERFPGIFIVATNLFRGLDTAALRRFTFKMELRPLNPDQRWAMFVSETGIKKSLGDFQRSQKDSWKADLYQMHQLAAGDFATVKRQCILLGETLTPGQWVEQLQIECDVKLESQAKDEADPPSAAIGAKTAQKLVH
jgi:hypothetical protein